MNPILHHIIEEPKTSPKRYAIYARFSDEKQNPKSVEDQIRECKQFIERQDNGQLIEACIYFDEGISGSHVFTRPGYQAMMRGAELGHFDVIVTEDLSRISRDQEDTARFHKVMQFNEIPILTLMDGEVNEITVGYKGTVNTVQLKYLAQSVKRGQRSKVKKGSHANGIAYGYDRVMEWDAQGELIRGKRVLNEQQAQIVRRIFKEYVDGRSPRQIAKSLNKEGIPSPRGGQWNPSTINGNRKRLNGILQNHLYAGFLIYGITYKVKHPATGKSLIRVNPQSEWVVTDVPELRIIDEATWDKAQERKNNNAAATVSRNYTSQKKKYFLSGLIKCGCCGANYIISGKNGRYRCSANKDKGTCQNNKGIWRDELEARVFTGLKTSLLSPEATKYFIEQFRLDLKKHNQQAQASRHHITKELNTIKEKIERIIAAIMEGTSSASLSTALQELEQRKVSLEQQLKQEPSGATLNIHPDLATIYHDKVMNLEAALVDGYQRDRAIKLLSELIEKIVVTPDKQGSQKVTMHSRFASILEFSTGAPNRYKLPLGIQACPDLTGSHKALLSNGAGEPARSLSNALCKTLIYDDGSIIIEI